MPKRKTKSVPRAKKTKSRRSRVSKTPRKNVHRQKRSPRNANTQRLPLRKKPKRTFQLTASDAKEVLKVFVGKGRKPDLTRDNAEKFLLRALKKVRAAFSRKKSSRWAVYLYIKWKHNEEGWRIRTIVHVASTPEMAIDGLLERVEDSVLLARPNSSDELATDKIIGAKFEKYIKRERKVFKAARTKKRAKKPRSVRRGVK